MRSVTPALSMATSVPELIASPTSAAARAGASLTPSPAIATTRPSLAEPLDDVALVVGQHVGLDPVDAEAAGDGFGGDPVVAGEHDDLDALGTERLERFGGGRLDRVGDGEDARHRAVDADEDGGRTFGAQPVGFARVSGPVSMPWLARKLALPRTTRVPSTLPTAPLPAGESKSLTSGMVSPASRRRRRRRRQRVFRGALDRRREPQDARRSSNPGAATIWVTDGLPSVRVPVLSTTRVLTFSIRSSASAFLMSTPRPAPRPTPTMIETGVASPSAQGQAMMRTATATIRACASRGSGPTVAQMTNAATATSDDGGHEPGGDPVGRPLDRCTGALGFGDHLHDAGQHRVAADLLGPHDERPGLVQGAADDGVAGGLGDRHRLPGHQRLVQRGTALLDDAVDRDLLAGADPQPVTDLDLVEGDLLLGAVGCEPVRGLRGQVEQRLDGTRGLFPGAQLQDLAEQDQGGDDGGGLEVHVDGPSMSRNDFGEDARARRWRPR